MAFIDYYKILGVPKDIAQKDVKKAYLKRAKQFHPDLHPDDAKAKAKFQALNEAYDVIGDPEKRRKYDQYGEQWREAEQFQQGGGGFRGSDGGSPFEGFDFSNFQGGSGFSSFFENLFGHGGGNGHGFSRIYTGGQDNGHGFSRFYTGGQDNGHGFSRFYTGGQDNGNGFSRFYTGSSGNSQSDETQASITIDMYTALLGGEVMVSLSNGTKLKLKVKPGTQPGQKVRLRGKGQGGTDLILTYNVTLPASLSPRQQELLREMQRIV